MRGNKGLDMTLPEFLNRKNRLRGETEIERSKEERTETSNVSQVRTNKSSKVQENKSVKDVKSEKKDKVTNYEKGTVKVRIEHLLKSDRKS